MYKATTSFVLNKNEYEKVDIKKGEILSENFASEDVINDLLQAKYIEVYDGSISITENGVYDVEEYETADVNVSGGGTPTLQDKSVTVTTNGTQNITADSGYDGLNSVALTTNVEPNNQSKEVTITTNGTTTITPDTGYDGLDKVEITTNVSGGGDLSNYFNTTIGSGSQFRSGVNTMIKTIPANTTVNGNSLSYAFNNCQSLTTIPLIDTSNVEWMNNMCSGCSSLTDFPLIDTSNVLSMNSMFNTCPNLQNVPVLNTSKVNNLQSMFGGGDIGLTDESLNNILKMCINATLYSGTKTLAYLGFLSSQYSAARIQALSNYQDFINAGWTIGY